MRPKCPYPKLFFSTSAVFSGKQLCQFFQELVWPNWIHTAAPAPLVAHTKRGLTVESPWTVFSHRLLWPPCLKALPVCIKAFKWNRRSSSVAASACFKCKRRSSGVASNALFNCKRRSSNVVSNACFKCKRRSSSVASNACFKCKRRLSSVASNSCFDCKRRSSRAASNACFKRKDQAA